jgi:hypothetical protein
MPPRLEHNEDGIVDDLNQVSGLLDRCTILADNVIRLCEVGQYNDRFSSVINETFHIKDALSKYPHLEFNYKGDGFAPVICPNGSPETAYIEIPQASGLFSDLFIADGSNYDRLSEIEVDEDTDGDLQEYIAEVEKLKSIIREPEEGPRLYIEFLTSVQDSEEQEIAGRSIRADVIKTYHIMNMAGLSIEFITDRINSTDNVHIEDLSEIIDKESDDFRELLRTTHFRRKTRTFQLRHMEEKINTLNNQLQLERYSVFISPDHVYVPVIKNKNYKMEKVLVTQMNSGFMVDPIRIDSLEHFPLTDGRRIYRDSVMIDPTAGLCLVGQIESYHMDALGIETDIIWIPISSQITNSDFMPKSSRKW